MKVIFLDFDGVLNNPTSVFLGTMTDTPTASPNKSSVDLFDFLIKATDAYIVISSSHRIGKSVEDLRRMMANEFMSQSWNRVIDVTRIQDVNESRGNQIQDWIIANYKKYDLTHWLILDDNSDMLVNQADNFVKIDPENGFSFKDLRVSLDILGEDLDVILKGDRRWIINSANLAPESLPS